MSEAQKPDQDLLKAKNDLMHKLKEKERAIRELEKKEE